MRKFSSYLKIITDTKLKYFFQGVGLIVLILILVNFGIKMLSKNYIIHQSVELTNDAKVGIVFGARFDKNGEPSLMLKDRLDSGIELFKSGKIDYLLLAGESLRPHISEVDVMEKYCVERGVPVEKIIIDGAALDTYSTVYRVKNIYQIKDPIFITQDFHLNRALFIGRMLNLDCVGYTADLHRYEDEHHDRFRELVSNVKAVLDVSLNRIPPFVLKDREALRL